MNNHNYHLYGLLFQSDIELHNLLPCQVSDAAVFPEEVRVQIEKCEKVPDFSNREYHQHFDELDFWIGTYQGEMATLLRFPEFGDFFMVGGRKIWASPKAGGPVNTFTSYLCSLAIANILFQRGCFILHASAVALPTGATIFLGDSGAGKTTLTAAFAKVPLPILSEDVTVIEYRGDVPYVLPGIPYLKLGPKTTKLLGWEYEKLPPLYHNIDKRAFVLEKHYATQAVPLRQICWVRAEDCDALRWEAFEDWSDQINCLAQNIHYPSFFMGYPLDETYSEIALRLANELSFQQVIRPEGQNTISQLIQQIQDREKALI